MADDVDRLFMCLLAIYVFGEMCIQIFHPFFLLLLGYLSFYYWVERVILYYKHKSLVNICLANIFSHSLSP